MKCSLFSVRAKYFAQFGEDKIIDEMGILPPSGLFVDVGANLPWEASNTAFLRLKGWAGVAIDALDFKELYDGFPFVQAVVSNKPEVGFNYGYHPLTVRVEEGATKVKTRTLESILKNYHIGKIDLLSIDVEGHELEVFDSMDFERHKPSIVIAEYRTASVNGGEDQIDMRIHARLFSLGYRALLDNGVNVVARLT